MKKILLLLFICMVCVTGFSQIKYEPGYIMNSSGEKITCLIKNADWKKNPKEISYKLSETSESMTGDVQTIKEFSVGGVKFKVFNVDIDRSSEIYNEMNNLQAPQFKNETLFLKSVIEGKASLYMYNEGPLTRYFFTVNGSPITQLIYKSYMSADATIAKNTTYKQQLWEKLNYTGLTMNEIENSSYNESSLIRVFNGYNKANNSESISYKQSAQKGAFHLGVRAGTALASASIYSYVGPGQVIGPIDFGSKATIRVGISLEVVLPFSQGSWSFFSDPNYQSYKSDVQYKGKKVCLDFSFIEIPIGVRHYFLLNGKSKIFANATYNFGSGSSSSIKFEDPNINNLTPTFNGNFSLGAGFKYQAISAELRYGFKQNIIADYHYYTSDYHTFSIIIGYDIF